MSAEEFREILKRLNLNQTAAAAFLGVNAVTIRRWSREEGTVPHAVSMLLRLMVAMKLTPEKVEEWLAAA